MDKHESSWQEEQDVRGSREQQGAAEVTAAPDCHSVHFCQHLSAAVAVYESRVKSHYSGCHAHHSLWAGRGVL